MREYALGLAAENEVFPVFPANWAAVQLFLCAISQICITPGGDIIGFRYEGVEVARRWAGLPKPDEYTYMAFREIEAAFVEGVKNG